MGLMQWTVRLEGVVQNLAFLGYTRRAEMAGL
jgi:hypothetical protein